MNDYEKNLNDKIGDAADNVIVELSKSIDKKKLEDVGGRNIGELLNLEEIMQKDSGSLTRDEKIVGFFQALIQDDRTAIKALAGGVAADGGYLVPDEFRAEVIRDLAEGGYMRTHVKVIPMKRDIMNIPSLSTRPKVTWTEENVAKSTTTAAFGQETLTVYKMAAIMYASDELVEDSDSIDIVKFIISLFSEAVGQEEDRVIWVGNGTTQPTGIVTARAAGNIPTSAAVGGLCFDALIDLVYSLPGKYHKNAKFFIHRQNIRNIRKLKDNENNYLWRANQVIGQPATLLGFPVIEVNEISADELFFGDMKQTYWLGDRNRMAVKVSQDTETAFTRDQHAIRVVERLAGNVVLGAAMRSLTGV